MSDKHIIPVERTIDCGLSSWYTFVVRNIVKTAPICAWTQLIDGAHIDKQAEKKQTDR